MFTVQRVYHYQGHKPAVLIDRLWPRGISKTRLAGVNWCKTIAPSTHLRQWFHQNPHSRYAEFRHLYQQELQHPEQQAAIKALHQQSLQHPQLLLLTAVKDIAHSHVPILLTALQA